MFIMLEYEIIKGDFMIITNSSNVIHFVNRPISRTEQLLFSPPHTMKDYIEEDTEFTKLLRKIR